MTEIQYQSSNGREYFISYESLNKKVLYAFVRLRLAPLDFKSELVPLRGSAIIRELHTYGRLAPLSRNSRRNYTQHRGLGKKLLQKAEEIARAQGYKKISLISGVGVREYYRK